jgi:hypothetical protein
LNKIGAYYSRTEDPVLLERDAKFDELADAQRGLPESAMLRIQHHLLGAGVASVVVESCGDLTNRMSQHFSSFEGQYGIVKDKVEKCLRYLKSDYGFEREMTKNMQNNYASYAESNSPKLKGRSFEEVKAEFFSLWDAYADMHRQLRVFNYPQRIARDAAIALGQRRFAACVHNLTLLKNIIDKGEEAYIAAAGEYHPAKTASDKTPPFSDTVYPNMDKPDGEGSNAYALMPDKTEGYNTDISLERLMGESPADKPQHAPPSLKRASGIPTWMQFLRNMKGIRGLLDELVAWDNYDPSELGVNTKREALVIAGQELKVSFDEYAEFHKSHTYPMKVWRVITLPDGIDSLNTNSVGIYWSWDMDAAESHSGTGRHGGNNWLLEAEIQNNDIDWYGTLLANIEPGNGADECEIRLKPGAQIKLISQKAVDAGINNSWSEEQDVPLNKMVTAFQDDPDWADAYGDDEDGALDYDAPNYVSGECYQYAIALVELTGFTPYIINDSEEGPVHAVVMHPSKKFLDASGLLTLKQIEKKYGLTKPFATPTTLEGLTAMCFPEDEEIEDAKKVAIPQLKKLGIPAKTAARVRPAIVNFDALTLYEFLEQEGLADKFENMDEDDQYLKEELYAENLEHFGTMTFPITVWRALEVPEGQDVNLEQAGVYWTWVENSADAYFGGSSMWAPSGAKKGEHVCIEAQVMRAEDVDWKGTMRANFIDPDENELRVLPGTELKLVGIQREGADFSYNPVPGVHTVTASSKTAIAPYFTKAQDLYRVLQDRWNFATKSKWYGKPDVSVGKLEGYDVRKTMDDEGAPFFALYDPVNKVWAAYCEFNEQKGEHYFTVGAIAFLPQYTGLGLAAKWYAWLIKNNQTPVLVSGEKQTRGGQGIWEQLAKMPGIFIYAWNPNTNEYFSVDQDDLHAEKLIWENDNDDDYDLLRKELLEPDLSPERYEQITDEIEVMNEDKLNARDLYLVAVKDTPQARKGASVKFSSRKTSGLDVSTLIKGVGVALLSGIVGVMAVKPSSPPPMSATDKQLTQVGHEMIKNLPNSIKSRIGNPDTIIFKEGDTGGYIAEVAEPGSRVVYINPKYVDAFLHTIVADQLTAHEVTHIMQDRVDPQRNKFPKDNENDRYGKFTGYEDSWATLRDLRAKGDRMWNHSDEEQGMIVQQYEALKDTLNITTDPKGKQEVKNKLKFYEPYIQDYDQLKVGHRHARTARMSDVLPYDFEAYVKKHGGFEALTKFIGIDTSDLERYAWSDTDAYEALQDDPKAQEEWLMERVYEDWWRRYDEALSMHDSWAWPLTIWRQVTLKDLNALKTKGIGIYWAYEESAAEAHWGDFSQGSSKFTIEAQVNEDSVDWESTMYANLNPSTGEDEKELTLKEGAPLKITRWKGDDGVWKNPLPAWKRVTAAAGDRNTLVPRNNTENPGMHREPLFDESFAEDDSNQPPVAHG